MILQRNNGAEYFQFQLLADLPGVRHAVFTRRMGFSRGPYARMNVGRSVGDVSDRVARNRALISACMGGTALQFLRQVHADEVVPIDAFRPAASDPVPQGDSLVTALAGVALVTQVADCQAVLICDPQSGVVANVHSGWRGSIRNILGRTVALMSARYGCEPARMLAGIGPSLGPCCAEFVNYREEIPPAFWRYKDGRDRFDFWAVSRAQLRRAGLPETQIEVGGLCTRCRTDLFFSYRGEGATGRFAAAIAVSAPQPR